MVPRPTELVLGPHVRVVGSRIELRHGGVEAQDPVGLRRVPDARNCPLSDCVTGEEEAPGQVQWPRRAGVHVKQRWGGSVSGAKGIRCGVGGSAEWPQPPSARPSLPFPLPTAILPPSQSARQRERMTNVQCSQLLDSNHQLRSRSRDSARRTTSSGEKMPGSGSMNTSANVLSPIKSDRGDTRTSPRTPVREPTDAALGWACVGMGTGSVKAATSPRESLTRYSRSSVVGMQHHGSLCVNTT